MNITPQLCLRLSRIINGNVSSFGDTKNNCLITNLRQFQVNVLGRNSTDPINNAFWIARTSIPDKTLNLGFLALLETEVTPLVNTLTQLGFTITDISQYSTFTTPRIIDVFFQSIESPIRFAQKARILSDLTNSLPQSQSQTPTNPALQKLCTTFQNIIGIGGNAEFFNTSCDVLQSRNLKVKVNGIPTTIGSIGLLNFSFQSLDPQGNALCIGSVGLLRKEVKPYLQTLRKQTSVVYSVLISRWFTNPEVLLLRYITIANPITFAIQTREVLQVLKL
ncbi:DUF1259 domain-containing protein [Hazenella sp. IB182357]|uniref:DUF1259 domain-containing protein n=1 Tax=Polycladospora coralii TaxID=2771432 RepID=A0A926N7S8_9BACL|nr:DUF1259 domain-containing protein [Polycladospora coralii]MBD1371108.1 DUF1259 domain-containing protein [Polycladospora coralii]MBS7530050.1 DUF1259 domain-containing protein [Polycladospora coralii]